MRRTFPALYKYLTKHYKNRKQDSEMCFDFDKIAYFVFKDSEYKRFLEENSLIATELKTGKTPLTK